jgi:hypothetical protein
MTLLNNKFKITGIIMVLAGFLLSAIYFLADFRFELPVFAVVSSYMKTSFFTTFKTNFADETILVLMLLGFLFWAFSKEKDESEGLWNLRQEALKRAIITNTGFLLFTVLFIYGSGFIAVILLNLILPFVFYLSYFYFLLAREKRKSDYSGQ